MGMMTLEEPKQNQTPRNTPDVDRRRLFLLVEPRMVTCFEYVGQAWKTRGEVHLYEGAGDNFPMI